MRIKRTRRRHCRLRKTDEMDKIRDPYFFDYWPFSAIPKTLWHLVSWCRSLLSCYRTISNGVVMAGLSDRPTIRMQICVARICICTSWHSRPVSGLYPSDLGATKTHSSRALFGTTRRSGPNFSTSSAPKFDAFYGPLFRELTRIRTRGRHDSARNPLGRSTTCLNGYHLDGSLSWRWLKLNATFGSFTSSPYATRRLLFLLPLAPFVSRKYTVHHSTKYRQWLFKYSWWTFAWITARR